MYSSELCPYCRMAERLLQAKGVTAIEKIRVDRDGQRLSEMIEKTQRWTVPQIFIDDVHIGGFDDLAAFDHAGKLERLLSA